MEIESNSLREELLEKALDSLQETEILARDRLIWGVDLVYRHLENVDGDWLEQWGDEERPTSTQSPPEEGRKS